MKKTVSINIGGIIFHIEEDGYEKLKNYLDSVNKYFASFDDSAEIVSDIEGRIAELFLQKLSDGRQTISLQDVEELIATMGTTRDFQASMGDETDAEPSATESESEEPSEEQSEEPESKSAEPRRLYRDTRKSILGGVAAGVAHYIKIDPLWIRLLFLAMFFNIFFFKLSGAVFLAYIILWIVIPPNGDLPENQKIKKLFRDSDSRVLGGVSAGIAAYFGIDVAVVRLLFVLSIFLGGSGILAYIVLWIITPEARSITDKMQMSGKPITLKNIETNLKKSFKVEEGEEKPWVKILLFPFRLIATFFQFLGKVLGPLLRFLVDAIRVAFGALLVFIGFSGTVAIIVALLSLAGLNFVHSHFLMEKLQIPLDLLRQSLDPWMVLGIFLTSIVPNVALILLGLVIILKRSVAHALVGWSLFAMWVIGFIISSLTIPKFIAEFSEDSGILIEESFEMTQATPILKLNEIGNDSFDLLDLNILGHEDSVYQVKLDIQSRGSSNSEARKNARMVQYEVLRDGESFLFDSKMDFAENAKFRFQTVDAYFYIPYGKVFRIEQPLSDILCCEWRSKRSIVGFNDWMFDNEKGLICLTCPESKKFEADDKADTDDDDFDMDFSFKQKPRSYTDSDELKYPFEGFDDLKIGSAIDIEIYRGDQFDVRVRGEERDLDEVYLNQVGSKLEVKFKNDDWKWWKEENHNRVKLIITMPELESIEINGACLGEVTGFEGENLEMEISGLSDIYSQVKVKNLDITVDGDSKLSLSGEAERMDIEVSGASKINSLNLRAQQLNIQASGAAKAMVFADENLKARVSGVSKVEYRGDPNLSVNKSGMGSVERH